MASLKQIQVYEHERLRVDDTFTPRHFNEIKHFHDKGGDRFLSLTASGVKFRQYVGVLQVSDLTIEVLPKISRSASEADKSKWQRVLIDMLQACHWMRLHAHDKASLRFRPNSILEAYLDLFLIECETILRRGLIKRYRRVEGNVKALKGQLVFSRHLQHNLVHAERFYTRHSQYDSLHTLNRILVTALRVIPVISGSPALRDRVARLLLEFPDMADLAVTEETFHRLVFDRRSEHYREAIDIASMLLLNYRPDITAGHNHVLAILFDMNDLWEEYVYRMLLRHRPADWSIRPNRSNSKPFWSFAEGGRSKTIRPDIVIKAGGTGIVFVLDTKWKIPTDDLPADADLKQMFVYNEYWGSSTALLVYPTADHVDEPIIRDGAFSERPSGQTVHRCGSVSLSVLDDKNQSLDKELGKLLIRAIQTKYPVEAIS